jgi:hypothetical protein
MFTACLPQHSKNQTRKNRSSGLIRNSSILIKQIIIDNSCLGLANTQYERFTPFWVIKIKGNDYVSYNQKQNMGRDHVMEIDQSFFLNLVNTISHQSKGFCS